MLKDIQTVQDYQEYRQRVQSFMQKEGIVNLGEITDKNGNTEEFFSWYRCSCCQRDLGGSRVEANGYNPETKEICGPYNVCTDCVFFAIYGQLDDMTMTDIDVDLTREECSKERASTIKRAKEST